MQMTLAFIKNNDFTSSFRFIGCQKVLHTIHNTVVMKRDLQTVEDIALCLKYTSHAFQKNSVIHFYVTWQGKDARLSCLMKKGEKEVALYSFEYNISLPLFTKVCVFNKLSVSNISRCFFSALIKTYCIMLAEERSKVFH